MTNVTINEADITDFTIGQGFKAKLGTLFGVTLTDDTHHMFRVTRITDDKVYGVEEKTIDEKNTSSAIS